MSVYITTNKDINHNMLLTESATCLFREDIVILVDIDGETTNEISYLIEISQKKKFQLYTVSLLEEPLKNSKGGLKGKCYDAIHQTADTYLDRNGGRKLIIVGYTLIPVLLSAYKHLKQKNVQPEARMICFFSDRKTSLTDRNKIEDFYRKNKPQMLYELEGEKLEKKTNDNSLVAATNESVHKEQSSLPDNTSRNRSEKSKKKNTPQNVLEINMDGTHTISMGKQKEEAASVKREIKMRSSDMVSANPKFSLIETDEVSIKSEKMNFEAQEFQISKNIKPVVTNSNVLNADRNMDESNNQMNSTNRQPKEECRKEIRNVNGKCSAEVNDDKSKKEEQNIITDDSVVRDITPPQITDIADIIGTGNNDSTVDEKISEIIVSDVMKEEGITANSSIKNDYMDASSQGKQTINDANRDSLQEQKSGSDIIEEVSDLVNFEQQEKKGFFHKAADKLKNTVNKGFGMGKAAGRSNQADLKVRFENSMGQPVMERKLSREELQKEILYQEESKIQEEPFPPQLIRQLEEYEKIIDKEIEFFQRELCIKSIADKDFFILINTLHFSKSSDDFQDKLGLILPGIRMEGLSETRYCTYKEHAQKVIDETNKF